MVCFEMEEKAVGRPCRPVGALGHRLEALAGGRFCLVCGAYTFQHVCRLGFVCRGRLADAAAAWRLKRMLRGRHPATGAFVGDPRCVDMALDMLDIILGP